MQAMRDLPHRESLAYACVDHVAVAPIKVLALSFWHLAPPPPGRAGMQKATNVVGLTFVRSGGLRPPELGRMTETLDCSEQVLRSLLMGHVHTLVWFLKLPL